MEVIRLLAITTTDKTDEANGIHCWQWHCSQVTPLFVITQRTETFPRSPSLLQSCPCHYVANDGVQVGGYSMGSPVSHNALSSQINVRSHLLRRVDL